MDHIRLTGMQFFGRHGVFEQEQTLGQRFIVHLDMGISVREAGLTDRLDKSVNYADVYEQVRKIVEGKPGRLLEHVAERIASAVLCEHPLVEVVEVEVEKPGAPIPGVFESVSVRITRTREHYPR